MGRTYPRLDIESFGAHLLKSGDLDPIYIALGYMMGHREMSREQLYRWLLVYWCFYNAGIASYLSELEGLVFWEQFRLAAANLPSTPSPIGGGPVNGNWPRGKERRHFRGQQAVKAATELNATFPIPEYAVVELTKEYHAIGTVDTGDPGDNDYYCLFEQGISNPDKPLSYTELEKRVRKWRGFGQWISFKVGDMLERVVGIPVLFGFKDAMYADPTKAALMQWKVWHQVPQDSTIDDEKAAVLEVVERLCAHFKDHSPPPLANRPLGIQEVETVLCKWKSHLGGHYPLNNDIHEIREGLAPWVENKCSTAANFLARMPAAL